MGTNTGCDSSLDFPACLVLWASPYTSLQQILSWFNHAGSGAAAMQ